MKITYKINGKKLSREEYRDQSPKHPIEPGHAPGGTCTGYPYLSDAMGVGATQIKDAYEASVRAGVPTQFVEHGRMAGAAEIMSSKHKRDLAHSLEMYDRNAGYSDPTPSGAKQFVENRYGPDTSSELI